MWLVRISKCGERGLVEEHLFLRDKRLVRLYHGAQKDEVKD
jgi:hypothetical protein